MTICWNAGPLLFVILSMGAGRALADDVAAADLFPEGVVVNAGWCMGVTGDAIRPGADVEENDKLELAPYFSTRAAFGDGGGWSAEVNAIYANFGRLVNKAGLTEFNDQESGTAVRRALVVDFGIKTRFWTRRRSGFGFNLLNTGFILDGEGDTPNQNALDAAGYLFAGPCFAFKGNDGRRAMADLLVGVSEILTGDEVFDFGPRAHPSIRLRPRFWVQFPEVIDSRPLDVGFWADLGTEEGEADAATVFFSFPIVKFSQ